MKPFRARLRFTPAVITFFTTLVVVVLFLVSVPILDFIEMKTYDLRFVSRGPRRNASPVALAVIDEHSLDTQGRWPWPRSKVAELVEVLSRQGARVIGFDIGFLEPEGHGDPGAGSSAGDRVLAEAIRGSQAAVVLGHFFHMNQRDLERPLTSGEVRRRLDGIAASRYPLTLFVDEKPGESPFIEAYAPEANLKILTDAAPASGYFNIIPDRDGVVRWMPLVLRAGGDLFSPLALQCVRQYLGGPDMVVRVSASGIDGIDLGDIRVPTDEFGRLLVNYLGPPQSIPHYSVGSILGGDLEGDPFRDKIVLVGATAVGIHDFEVSPFGPVYPGVEVHATAIENMLSGNFLNKPRWTEIFDLGSIVAVCTVTGVAVRRLGALSGTLFLGGFLGLHLFLSGWMFVRAGVWLNIVYPLLGLVATGGSLTVYKYFAEERQRKVLRGTFGRYVSDPVIETMLQDPGKLQLGGEVKALSVLFCDLVGFTGHAESLEPHEMVEIIGDFFKEMTDQIFAQGGTLKEYVGDEVMGIFGAPLHHPDHAARACRAALAMQERLRTLRSEWPGRGRPALRARIGVNSGPMLVGNLGSVYRFSYGVLGDNVNLGSRLEALNKLYGTEIIVGANTARMVEARFRLRLLDWVRVKGRQAPESIYELLGPTGELFPTAREASMRCYGEALEFYRAGHWREAIPLLEESLVQWPGAKAARVMRGRCRYFLANPIQDEWDGVFRERRK